MITLKMPVCGFGDLYAAAFEAIARVFGTNIFQSLLHVTILLAGFSVLASFVMRRDLFVIVRWFFYFYLLVYVCFIPKINLEIVEQIQQKPSRVANVPLGLGLLASISSQVSVGITQLMEENFSMPDDPTYSKTGMVFSAQILRAVRHFEITDSRMNANMERFVQQCIFYDLWFKKYSLQELISTNDLWGFLKQQKMSPVRGMVYTDNNHQDQVLSCDTAFTHLTADWQQALSHANIFYAGRMFGTAQNPVDFLAKYLPISYSFLTRQAQMQADEIMKQTMMANAIERGAMYAGAKVNAVGALQSYSYVRANAQKRMTNQTVGEMACYWLPLIKVSLEIILYGAFILVLLIAIFPFGQKSLQGYLGTLVWVQLWPPLFALFHLIISFYGRYEVSSAMQGGLTLQNLSSLEQITSDMVGLAGYMSMSVPAVAGFVLWGAHHSFAQVSQYIGGVTQSASSQSAAEISSGNISLGNTSFGNHNAFNTNTNKYDTNMRAAGGSSSLQLEEGTQLTMMPAGQGILNMQGAISQTGMNFDMSESLRATFGRAAEHATQTSQQRQIAYGHSETAVARDANSLSHHLAHSEGLSTANTESKSAGIAKAASTIDRVNDEVSKRTGLSRQEAESLTASVYGEVKGGVSFGTPNLPGKIFSASIGGSAGTSSSSSSNDTNQLSRYKDIAKSVMTSHHYNENVDLLTRAIKDESLRTNSEDGSRYLSDISHSLDKADHARQEWSANVQKADYLRKTASIMTDKGSSFRDNLNQEFIQFIAKQPDIDGSHEIGMSRANTIFHDQQLRERYAEQFLQQKVANVTSNWSHELPASEQGIKNAFQHHQASVGTTRHIEAINKSHHNLQDHLKHIEPYDHQASQKLTNHVEKTFTETEQKLKQDKQLIRETKIHQEKNTHDELDKYQRRNIYWNIAGLKDVNKDNER